MQKGSKHSQASILKISQSKKKISFKDKIKICETCNKSFISKRKSFKEIQGNKFCSYLCLAHSPALNLIRSVASRKHKHSLATIIGMRANLNKTVWGKLDEHPNWNGGKIIELGYRLIKKPEHPYSSKRGYVREHRLVMEQSIGRYLLPTEVIHHINGDKLDNRIENLKLFNSSSEHHKIGHPELHRQLGQKNRGKHFSLATEFKKGHKPFIRK